MKRLIVILLLLVAGITLGVITFVKREYPKAKTVSAITSLNKQIEHFNSTRDGNMGIAPIDKRVSRLEHYPELDQITTFDQNDAPFFVLKRESDGRFKGTLKQPYHQLVGSGPAGSHSWGHVLAEIILDKGLF